MFNILVVVPHYYKKNNSGAYGSENIISDNKIRSLQNMISALRDLFSEPHAYSTIGCRKTLASHRCKYIPSLRKCFQRICGKINYCDWMIYHPANMAFHYKLDIVICTNQQDHLCESLNLPEKYYTHQIVQCDNPRYLGFAAQKVLKDNKGQYDYYCFMEDDLIIHDSLFFAKIHYFSKKFGVNALLQPNRYERLKEGIFHKGYIDVNSYNNESTRKMREVMYQFVDYRDKPNLSFTCLGNNILFEKAYNPHSGCFFLSANQFELFANQPFFAMPTHEFVGPLESAATLGIARTFSVYKPSFENAAFLEVEHGDARYLLKKIKAEDEVDYEAFEKYKCCLK
jgi:hypothetical protein